MVDADGSVAQLMAFYDHWDQKGAHMASNTQLLKVDATCRTRCLHAKIEEWMEAMPDNKFWTNWRVSSLNKCFFIIIGIKMKPKISYTRKQARKVNTKFA